MTNLIDSNVIVAGLLTGLSVDEKLNSLNAVIEARSDIRNCKNHCVDLVHELYHHC